MYSKLVEKYVEIKREVEDYLEKLCLEQYTVILFGSRARGDYRPDSDWDILVIGEEKPVEPLLPINIFHVKPGELADHIKNFNTIVIDAFYEGKPICDKNNIYMRYREETMKEITRRKAVKKHEGWFIQNNNRHYTREQHQA